MNMTTLTKSIGRKNAAMVVRMMVRMRSVAPVMRRKAISTTGLHHDISLVVRLLPLTRHTPIRKCRRLG